ncbi:hypothetical protein MPTK2_1g05600 [Marchantia polymorpha subsp. ruderalis]
MFIHSAIRIGNNNNNGGSLEGPSVFRTSQGVYSRSNDRFQRPGKYFVFRKATIFVPMTDSEGRGRYYCISWCRQSANLLIFRLFLRRL